MMREPMFRAEQWGMKEEYPDDDGVRCRAMAADSQTLSRRDNINSGEGSGVYLDHVSVQTWSREQDSLLSISKKIRQRGN